ncbi:hypothetical protein GE061_011021 [Apolygus lucorum]|uniref:Peptidase S1 domain-containing protein n=1 Tax=Apolygus lucorum TaxID=248454 RepID=A0A8S9XWJ9_APOLU|nr:hypothetical protein GE061_011021 [Apolygus lucorum]
MSSLLPNLARLSTESRKKRILYGLESPDTAHDFYQSFRYYVFLARAPEGTTVEVDPDTYHFWKVLRWFKKVGAKVEWIKCGGSLITPNTVQTACHCVAFYTRRPPKDSGYLYNHARAMNVWEDRIYSYLGANEVANMAHTPLVPKHYVVYEQCKQFIPNGFNVMDFALIINKDSVATRVPTAEISYAPVYKAEDILKYYYKNVQVERMCLVIGHGYWNVQHQEKFVLFIQSLGSELQRWGWRTIMNSVDCEASTFDLVDKANLKKQYHADFDYASESTWVCLQHSDKESKRHRLRFGKGDSGGPVSCDGAYFAVASMIQEEFSMAAPIAHTTFENAAEFRDDFMRWIDRFETGNEDEPVEHITDRIYVPTPEVFPLLPNLVMLTTESRKKRVLFGLDAPDTARDFYQSFRYYVFLAKAPKDTTVDEDPESKRFWKVLRWFKKVGARVTWTLCGGSLLTPNVVQTACHCISTYSKRPPKDSGYLYTHAVPLNTWEDHIYSYVGANEISNMPQTMLVPKRYVVYEQCRELMGIGFNVMDFGLIITKSTVAKRVPTAPISYAPVYKAADILKYYYKNIQVERMCLVIGHGIWHVLSVVESNPSVESIGSDVQKWGWRTIMNRADCESTSFDEETREYYRKYYNTEYDYGAASTWVCLKTNDKHWKRFVHRYGGGDSGGPLSCDGAYFAVNSMVQEEFSFAAPIAYTSFENAAEFRDDFSRWIVRVTADKTGPQEHITDRIYVPTPEAFRLSRSSTRKIEILPLLFYTLVSAVLLTLFNE